MTGTFDDWAKGTKLEKNGTSFEKRVELPKGTEKIYYKVSDEDAEFAPPDSTSSNHSVDFRCTFSSSHGHSVTRVCSRVFSQIYV